MNDPDTFGPFLSTLIVQVIQDQETGFESISHSKIGETKINHLKPHPIHNPNCNQPEEDSLYSTCWLLLKQCCKENMTIETLKEYLQNKEITILSSFQKDYFLSFWSEKRMLSRQLFLSFSTPFILKKINCKIIQTPSFDQKDSNLVYLKHPKAMVQLVVDRPPQYDQKECQMEENEKKCVVLFSMEAQQVKDLMKKLKEIDFFLERKAECDELEMLGLGNGS